MGCQRDLWKEYQLKRGEYYVFVEVDWIEKVSQTEFILNSYGVGQAFFTRDDKSLYKRQDILTEIYRSCALQEREGCKKTNYA